VGLVLLALLDGRVGGVQVGVVGEALDCLLRQVAVGHRVPEDGDALAVVPQELRDVARRLALAGAGPDCADGDDGPGGGQHRAMRREQGVRGARGQDPRADVHHVLVGHVGVGEHDLVDVVLAHQLLELGLRVDGDPGGIEMSCELRRIAAAVDVRDLRRRERDDFVLLTAAVDEVEVVEVAARGADDHEPSSIHE
jgi:hypothetical protein